MSIMSDLGTKIGGEFKTHRLRIENVETGKVDKVAGKQLSSEDYTSLEKSKLAGIESGAQVNTVSSVSGKTGVVTLTKSDVGLSNVDNTSDLSKPVSTAVQTALNNKVDKVAGKGLSTNDYTDLDKAKLLGIESGAQVNTVTSVAGKTGTVTLSKNDVGLSNVDNTSDVNKPISNAVQTALDLKADEATTLGGYGITDAYTKTEIDSVNTLRADRYLAAQSVANMVYTNGDLTKIQYKNATDVDYEVLTYSNGDLATVQHYVGGVLKGTTTLSYASGNLVSAIFVGV